MSWPIYRLPWLKYLFVPHSPTDNARVVRQSPFTTKSCRILPSPNHWIVRNRSWRQLHTINYIKVCQSQIKISRTCLAYIMQSDVNELRTVSTRSLCSVCLHAARSIVPRWRLLGLEAWIERLALLPRVREVLLSNLVPDAGYIDFEISRCFPHHLLLNAGTVSSIRALQLHSSIFAIICWLTWLPLDAIHSMCADIIIK